MSKYSTFFAGKDKLHGIILVLVLLITIVTGSVLLMRSRAAEVPAAYPLKASANNRYLVDQNGNPQFMAADTAWNLFSRLTVAEATQYLDARKNQGFNTILTTVIDISAGGIGGTNLAGQRPFTNNNIGTPNAAYFSHIDTIVNLARDRGLQLVILPAWLSVAAKESSYTTANTTTYGKWLGTRYQNTDNIIWMVGGDYGGAAEGICPKQAETRALAVGIRSTDSRHLITYHPGYGYASSSCYNSDSWLGINSNYWDFNYLNPSSAYRFTYRDYAVTPTRPVIMMETGYEGPFMQDQNVYALSARTSRMQSYWMALSGAMGFTYGAQSTCAMVNGHPNFNRTWQQTLTIPGGFQQGYVAKLFNSFDWWKLVPDQNHSVVTGGWGTYGQTDYVTAGRTSDGTAIAAYLPTARTVTVDMSKLSAAATAQWYDPTNNTYASAGINLANSGSKQFAAPARNSAGDSDFVLLLRTGGVVTPPPPGPGPTPPPPPPGTTIINDNVVGTATNQWQYTGSGWAYYTDGGSKYEGDDHSSGTAGDYATLKFQGTKAEYYGPKSPQAGIIAVSVDGGSETMIDLYSATRFDNTLLFATPTLTSAIHNLKIRLTGNKNPAAIQAAAAVDRAVVLNPATTPPPPPPTPTPTPTPPPTTGDANADGRVNAIDLSLLITHDGQNYPAADFNHDGTVGAADLAILLSKWTW